MSTTRKHKILIVEDEMIIAADLSTFILYQSLMVTRLQ